jgi:hypothetical protein
VSALDTTPTTPTVRIIEVRFLEDEVYDGGIPTACYDNATVTDYDADDVEDAVRILTREGVTFAATGNDWAANPDGSYISNYATAERVETTGHLFGFSDADFDVIVERVG